MLLYVVGTLAARIATVLCVVVIVLPCLLRRNRLSGRLGLAQEHAVPYLRRLWPHFWVGYLILAYSLLHAATVMGAMRRASAAGIWAATGAFFLLLFELVVGLSLREENLKSRKPLRRIHFWIMILFVALLGMHLWLNG
jgi:hypothetical protein